MECIHGHIVNECTCNTPKANGRLSGGQQRHCRQAPVIVQVQCKGDKCIQQEDSWPMDTPPLEQKCIPLHVIGGLSSTSSCLTPCILQSCWLCPLVIYQCWEECSPTILLVILFTNARYTPNNSKSLAKSILGQGVGA